MTFRVDLYLGAFIEGLNRIEPFQTPDGKFVFRHAIFKSLVHLEGDTAEQAKSLLKLHVGNALESKPVEVIDDFFEDFYRGLIK
jgi:hypothetical protein